MNKSEKYDTLVKQLFDILDTVEENSEGKEFRPTVIRSCRTQHTMRLESILAELKKLCNGEVR
jgi:hypothetical protein